MIGYDNIKKNKGSITIEAAMISLIAVFCIVAIIELVFIVYDKAMVNSTLGELSLLNENEKDAMYNDKYVNNIINYIYEKTDNRLIVYDIDKISISKGIDNDITIYISMIRRSRIGSMVNIDFSVVDREEKTYIIDLVDEKDIVRKSER